MDDDYIFVNELVPIYKNSDGLITNKNGKIYKLKNELASVLWGDEYNSDLIKHILENNSSTITIADALKLKLDESPNVLWGENLHTYKKEMDRIFLRLILEI